MIINFVLLDGKVCAILFRRLRIFILKQTVTQHLNHSVRAGKSNEYYFQFRRCLHEKVSVILLNGLLHFFYDPTTNFALTFSPDVLAIHYNLLCEESL